MLLFSLHDLLGLKIKETFFFNYKTKLRCNQSWQKALNFFTTPGRPPTGRNFDLVHTSKNIPKEMTNQVKYVLLKKNHFQENDVNFRVNFFIYKKPDESWS